MGIAPLVLAYSICDLFLAFQIAVSNFIVLFVYVRCRHIRTPTNAYIFSLAVTDFLAGVLGIPITVASVLTGRPTDFLPCLGIHLILCILCTISTFHLLAMAIDKFLTICCKRCRLFAHHQQQSSRHARAKLLIALSWTLGAGIASLPLVDAFGFASSTQQGYEGECRFTKVVDYRYLVYVIFFSTILIPSLMIAFCYTAIYMRIRIEERQIKCLLRAAERQRRIRNRRKLLRILMILVFTYGICWYPLYLLNTVDLFIEGHTFHPLVIFACVVLSHINCLINPIIYAYGMPGFKQSLRKFFIIPAATVITNKSLRSKRDGRVHGSARATLSVGDAVCRSVKRRILEPASTIGPSSPRRFSTSLLVNDRFSELNEQSGVISAKKSARITNSSEAMAVETINGNADSSVDQMTPRWKLLPRLRGSISSVSRRTHIQLGSRRGSTALRSEPKPKRKFALMLLARRPRRFLFNDTSQPSTSETMDSELAAAVASARKRSKLKHDHLLRSHNHESYTLQDLDFNVPSTLP